MTYLVLAGVLVAIVLIEFLSGGTRFIFALPSYALLGLSAVVSLSVFFLRRTPLPADRWCLASAVTLLAYHLGRTLMSPVEYLARPDLSLGLAAGIIYLLCCLILVGSNHRFWLVGVLLFLSLFNVGLGCYEFVRRESISIFSFIQPADYGRRATGLYICPNHLSGFLEITSLMAISIACWGRLKLWVKIAAIYVALVCLVGIILTYSRAGYLSILVGLTTFSILSLLTIRKAIPDRFNLAMVSVVAIALIGGGLVVRVMTRDTVLQRRVQKAVEERDIRLDLWEAAIKQFQLAPVFGTGAGTYNHYSRYFRKHYFWADPEYAHSDYLQYLAEFGLVGVACAGLFLFCHVRAGWQFFRWSVTERRRDGGRLQSNSLAFVIGALSVTATYLVHSIFDFNLHIPVNALVVAAVLAFLANPGSKIPLPSFKHTFPSRAGRFLLPVLGVWLIWIAGPRIPAEYFAERARVAERDENHQAAIGFAERGLRHDARNYLLYFYLGQAHLALGEAATETSIRNTHLQAAEVALRAGVKLYPQDKWLLFHLGWTLDAQGRHQDATEYFERAVAWDPQSFQAHNFLGAHLVAAGRLADAKRAYEKSMALWQNEIAWRGLERIAKETQSEASPRSSLP